MDPEASHVVAAVEKGGPQTIARHDEDMPYDAEDGRNSGRLAVWGRAFMDNRLAMLGVGLILFFVLFSWVGPLVYHTNQVGTNLGASDQPPSRLHLLGTDDVGYDVLGRLMAGGQTSLEIALAAAALATCLGAVWGAVAGYVGGIVDAVMMRFVDALLAIPALFLLLFLSSIVTPSIPLLIVIIAMIAWLVPSRLVRSETLSLRERDFVQAVRVQGGGPLRVIFRHILPNTVGTIAVNATFQVADAILVLAYLSYLGLGLPAPNANWGDMLSNGVEYAFSGYWWLIWPAGICIIGTVVGFNLLGDALRDSLDVRLRKR